MKSELFEKHDGGGGVSFIEEKQRLSLCVIFMLSEIKEGSEDPQKDRKDRRRKNNEDLKGKEGMHC